MSNHKSRQFRVEVTVYETEGRKKTLLANETRIFSGEVFQGGSASNFVRSVVTDEEAKVKMAISEDIAARGRVEFTMNERHQKMIPAVE